MIRKSVISVGILGFFLQAAPSLAGHAWRYNVHELHGQYTNVSGMGELMVFPIDMRKTFSSISSVSVFVKGIGYPGLAIATDGSNEEFELPVVFQFRVADEFVPGTGSLDTPVAQSGPFEGAFSNEVEFALMGRQTQPDFSFLLDGKAELRFSWGLVCPDGGCHFLDYAVADIKRVVVKVVGTRR
jgi:hypothetical protein